MFFQLHYFIFCIAILKSDVIELIIVLISLYRIWCPYSACQASWAQHQVKFIIILSKACCCFFYWFVIAELWFVFIIYFFGYQYYLTKCSVLIHLVICYSVFFSINFQLDVILFLGCQIEVKIIIWFYNFVGNDSLVLLE